MPECGGYSLGATSMMLAGSFVTLFALTTQIDPTPWWSPQFALPLFGMVLGNTMTGVSLGLDTLHGSMFREKVSIEAQLLLGRTRWQAVKPVSRRALRSGFTPIINAMAATGVVSLPGMMTGQILSGVDPQEAVKYQLLIMFLIGGATGLGCAGSCFFQHLAADRSTPSAATGPVAHRLTGQSLTALSETPAICSLVPGQTGIAEKVLKDSSWFSSKRAAIAGLVIAGLGYQPANSEVKHFPSAVLGSHDAAGGTATPIWGHFDKPDGSGPFPAVVLMHGCSGLHQTTARWAAILNDAGYATLILDSFGPRSVFFRLRGRIKQGITSQTRAGCLWSFGVLAQPAGHSAVQNCTGRLVHGGIAALGAVAASGISTRFENKFAAAVVFYPYCLADRSYQLPVLLLIGEADDWTPAAPCIALHKRTLLSRGRWRSLHIRTRGMVLTTKRCAMELNSPALLEIHICSNSMNRRTAIQLRG